MRATTIYILVLGLLLSVATFAEDEIDYDQDPIVTVDVEKSRSDESRFSAIALITTTLVVFTTISFMWCRARK